MPDCKIRVTANDGQAENNTGSDESNTFILDTKDPTDYGCSTPTNGATDVSINPDLTCLTASDDSPPISYYFQLAENDTFTQGLQESGWQSNTTWSPPTLDYNTQYFWRVKVKDNYDNETGYSSAFNFITELAGAGPQIEWLHWPGQLVAHYEYDQGILVEMRNHLYFENTGGSGTVDFEARIEKRYNNGTIAQTTGTFDVESGQDYILIIPVIPGGYDWEWNDDYDLLVISPSASSIPPWLGGTGDHWGRASFGEMSLESFPRPNTPPEVTSVTASQSSPIVDISYDVSDAEQSEITISFEYWDGASWEACVSTTGDGTQTTGTGKSGTWDAKTDFDEHYMTDCKIRVTADDEQAENNIGSAESSPFTLDTKDPTDYGCNTPTNGATDVSINPELTCLTASDDSLPISYYFQLAENDTFTQGLQESGWQSNTTWSPSTLDYSKQYFWRVKAKDSYGNETDYGSTFNFTTEPASYDIPLFAGWNLIGLPLIPESQSIEDVLADISVDGVATYDGATQTWYLYSPGAPSDLTEMTHGKGYWVKVTSPCTLTIEGTAPQLPYDIPLFGGWNLIGLPLIPESQSIEDVLADISVDGVATYDGATQTWYLYSPGVPSDLTEMTHGKGYWIKVNNPCTLTIEGGSE